MRALSVVVAVAGLVAALVLAPAGSARHDGRQNPCAGAPKQTELRCPELRMRAPFDIHQEKRGGRKLLRSGNSIENLGPGAAELRGRRTGARKMIAKQTVYRKGGGVRLLRTGARLKFKRIPDQGGYWKFRNAARFELWRLNARGVRTERVQRGRKQVYCLRDLQHTRPGAKGSPSSAVYPSCSQDRTRRRVRLGTSSGWSDVYPASYHEQWIDVTNVGRKGCYAYVHIADPGNRIHERREGNNEASTVVRLGRRGNFRGICDRRDRGVTAAQQGDGSAPAGLETDVDPDSGEPYPGGYGAR